MILVVKDGKFKSISGGQYDGEKIPGDLSEWNILSNDSNDILRSTYGTLSKRSASLYHTYGPARAAINKQVEYAVGPGLAFRSFPDWQSLGITRESAKDWGKEFQKIAHYYMSKMSFYQNQSVLMRGGLVSGDSLLFFIRENGELSDLVEFGGDQIDWQHNTGNHTLGVWHDGLYRRKGVRKNGETIAFQDAAGNQTLVQYYKKELPRQLRGYPLIYSIINLAKNDDRHTDATTHRAVMESILIGSFQTETSDPYRQTKNMAEANLKKATGNENASLLTRIANSFKLGAGNMYQLRSGEKIEFTDLKTPNNSFAPFKEYILDYIGMATGTPAQVMMSKYETSFTSHKGTFNDFIKAYTLNRRNFEKTVMYPVIREIAKDAILRGYISAPGFFDNPMIQWAYLQGTFLGPVPGTINPLQEVNAEVKKVENALTTRADSAALFGNEWDNMITEWGAQEAQFYSLSPEKQAEAVIQEEIDDRN